MHQDIILDPKKLTELFVSYLKDMKQDHIIFYVHPEAIKELAELKITLNDIQKQKDDLKYRASTILYQNNAITGEEKIGQKGYLFNIHCFTDIWKVLCDLATKNIPEDFGISAAKIENAAAKFKFIPLTEEQYGDHKVRERAIVRILLPKK